MDTREQRGLTIAATCKLTNKGSAWFVPSQSGNHKYTVFHGTATILCCD